MGIESFTLLLVNAVISYSLWLSLFFYQKTQKTYPGFSLWVVGTLIVAIGHTGMCCAYFHPFSLVNNLIATTSITLVAVLRLEGTVRFLNHKPLNKIYIIFPVLFIIFSIFREIYHLDYNYEIVFRSVLIITFSTITARFFYISSRKNPGIFKYAGSLFLVFGIVELIYVIMLFIFNVHHLNSLILHRAIFLFLAAFEVAWGISYMMMNGLRLETDLTSSQKKLQNSIDELESALSEIKKLSGLLPICSSCKRIRDDKGYWNQLEAFLVKHSDAQFSHSICPDCAKKLYPEFISKKDPKTD